MNVFTLLSFINAALSGYVMFVSVKKLTECHNPYIIQIINIGPWLGFVSILLHLSCVVYGKLNSIWDVRLLAWQLWDVLALLLIARLISVVNRNDKTS